MAAQSPAGRWSAVLQPGSTMTLDIAVADGHVTGTLTLRQGAGAMGGTIEQATLDGSTLTFTVKVGDQTSAFVGEIRADEIRLRSAPNPDGQPLVLRRGDAAASTAAPVSTPAGWRSSTRSARLGQVDGRTVITVDAADGEGVVWQVGSALQDGSIDVDLRGRDVVGQSFLGVAFRGVDDTTFDVVYFRPFNFATTDADRKLHAVQYHSSPEFPWSRLRAEHPNQYEKPITPVPDPNGWFHARIVLAGPAVNVFVNDSRTATLTVTALAAPRRGMVGFWAGNGSGGEYSNLTLTPAR